MKFYIIISSLFISQAACCGENQWLAAGYIDTLNKLNIKGGVTFLETNKLAVHQEQFLLISKAKVPPLPHKMLVIVQGLPTVVW